MDAKEIAQGFCDFNTHVLTPRVVSLLPKPWEKTALEIGHGEGRLLHAACRHFKFAVGADIHDRNEEVGAFLREQGVENFRLNKTEGNDLGMLPESVDFVYSYDTLRSVESFEMFNGLLRDTFDVLRAPGVAMLHIETTTLKPTLKYAKQLGFEVIDSGVSGPLTERGKRPKKGDQSFILLFKRTAGCLLQD